MRDLDDIARRFALSAEARAAIEALFDQRAPTLVAEATIPLDDETTASVPDHAGRYEDLGLIGVGGMGEVRRVRDRELNRVLAMKILRPELQGSRGVLARFVEEAQATAQLEHPGIVPVHELGKLPDGRLYFTMKEVRGKTLTGVIAEAHGGSTSRSWAAGGAALPRLIDAFRRVCEAVAHAHARGVIHRDLKPDNVMVGAYGEVLVLDWGIARITGRPDPALHDEELAAVDTARSRDAAMRTRAGSVTGTPVYMPPEQARGETDALDARADVYALGAILYELLSGRSPYDANQSARAALDQVIAGPPRRPPVGVPPVPPELRLLCERAMARDPAARFPHAGALAAEVVRWQEGAEKRERALSLVAEAEQQLPRVDVLRRQAAACRAEASRLAETIKQSDPIELKRPWWELEDEGARLGSEADMAELHVLTLLQGALTHAPDLAEAHALLADLYRRKHEEAEIRRDDADARRQEALLRAHDDGRHSAYLEGDGALTLVTDPPGAEVDLLAYTRRDRRLVPELLRSLGRTPLRAVTLPMGSYLLLIRAPGCVPVRYPVHVRREQHWDGVPPGGSEPFPIRLPREGELSDGDRYVPAGWADLGDALHGTAMSRRRTWVGGFTIRRDPVTNDEYIAFLDALVRAGREADALRHAPRERSGAADKEGAVIYGRTRTGGFELRPDTDGDAWDPRWPVLLVDWHGARAYAAWYAQLTGHPWRLPGEYEWEKAGRGVDARAYPWGNHLDDTWVCARHSRPGRHLPARVDEFPVDDSPYGVRGLAGNVSDWCLDAWTPDGPPVVLGAATVARGRGTQVGRVNRGGAWSYAGASLHLAVRRQATPGFRSDAIGFRLCRSFA